MKKPLKLPKFKNEDEERKFWAKINLADYYESGDFISMANHLYSCLCVPKAEKTIELSFAE